MVKGRRVSGIWVPIQLDTSSVQRDMESLGTQLSTTINRISRNFEGALNPKNILKGVVDVNKALGELRDSSKVWGMLGSDSQKFETTLRGLRPALRDIAKQFGGTIQQQREMYQEMARTQAIEQEVRALQVLQKALNKTQQETVEFVKARGMTISDSALDRFAPKEIIPAGKFKQLADDLREKFRQAAQGAGLEGRQELERAFVKEGLLQELYNSITKIAEGTGVAKDAMSSFFASIGRSSLYEKYNPVQQLNKDVAELPKVLSGASSAWRQYSQLLYTAGISDVAGQFGKFERALRDSAAVDAARKLGETLGWTTEELRKQAEAAGFTAEMMDKLVPPERKKDLQDFTVELGKASTEYRNLAKAAGVAASQKGFENFLRAQDVQAAINAFGRLYDTSRLTRKEIAQLASGSQYAAEILEKFAPSKNLRDFSQELGKTATEYRKLAQAAGEVASSSGYKDFMDARNIKNAIDAYERLHAGQRVTVDQYGQIARAANVSTEAVERYVAASRRAGVASEGGRGWMGIFTPSSVSAGVQSAFASLGVVGGMYGITELGKAMYEASLKMDNLDIAFESIYNSSAKAGAQLDYVRKLSSDLGLSFVTTAEGAKKLFASARGTELEKDANQIFRAFSSMGAALKLSGTEMDSVFLAISQIISKGKVSAEELRLQLSERMPGAVTLFAKSIGVTTKELDNMLQKGEVGLDSLRKFAIEVEKTYAAGAAAASTGLQAEMNRVANAWFDLKRTFIDTAGSAKALSTLASALRTLVDFAPQLATLIALVGKFAVITAPVYLLIKAFNALSASVAALRSAMAAGTLAAFLSPAAALAAAAAIGLLGTAIWSMKSHQTEGEKVFDSYNSKLFDLSNWAKDARDSYAELNAEMAKNEAQRRKQTYEKAQKDWDAFAVSRPQFAPEDWYSYMYGSQDVQSGAQYEVQLDKLKQAFGGASAARNALLDEAKSLGNDFVKKFSEGQKEGMSGDEATKLINDYAAKLSVVREKLIQSGDGGKEAADSFGRIAGALLGVANNLANAKANLDTFDTGLSESEKQARAFADAYSQIQKAAQGTDLEKELSFGKEASSMANALITMAKSAETAELKLYGIENASEVTGAQVKSVQQTIKEFDQALLLIGQTAVKNKADFAVLEQAIQSAGEKAGMTAAEIKALQDRLREGFVLGGVKTADEIVAGLKVEQVLAKSSAGQKKAFTVLRQFARDAQGELKLAEALASGSADKITDAFKDTSITGEQALRILKESAAAAANIDLAKGANKAKNAYESVEKAIERINRQIDTWGAKTKESKTESVDVQLSKYTNEIDRLTASGKATAAQVEQLKKLKIELQDAAAAYQEFIRVKEREKAMDLYKSAYNEYSRLSGITDPTLTRKSAQAVYDEQLAEAKRFYENGILLKQEYLQLEEMLEIKKNDTIRRNSEDLYDNLTTAIEDYYAKYRNFATGMGEVVTTAMDGMASAIANFATTGMQNLRDLGQAFADLANNILRMVNQLLAQQLVSSLFKGLFGEEEGGGGLFSGLFNFGGAKKNAKGGVYAGSSLSSFSNSVVRSPTLFSMGTPIPAYAKGAGLMGEAGPEAIMPLVRTSSGHLGVRAEGPMGAQQTVTINIINNAGVDVKQEESQDEYGNPRFDIVLERQVAQSMVRPGSPTNRALQSSYGARQVLANR